MAGTVKTLLENAGQILALLLSFCALLGLLAKYVVLPWLEDRFAPLAAQLKETHHQVTTNGHTSSEPTLKDTVHTLQNEVRELKGETRADLSRVHMDLRAAGKLYDAHIDWSSRHGDAVWRELRELRGLIGHNEDDGNPAADEGEHDE